MRDRCAKCGAFLPKFRTEFVVESEQWDYRIADPKFGLGCQHRYFHCQAFINSEWVRTPVYRVLISITTTRAAICRKCRSLVHILEVVTPDVDDPSRPVWGRRVIQISENRWLVHPSPVQVYTIPTR